MRATQKTTRTYFDNGKLHTDTITNGANAVNAVNAVNAAMKTHTVAYETSGVFINGNRTSDPDAPNGPSSTVCTGITPICTATYTP